ncbi:MAG: TetR/AcrR family transcriptional regulator [Pseudomonadota bacterium]
MATNEERREATRARILAAAREGFTRDGYEETHTSSILEQADISRGALYHHYASKRDVFEAVYVAVVEESIAHAVGAGQESDSPLEDLIAGCLAWLRWVRKPQVSKILIVQGPQVLGLKRARDIEAKSSLAPMRRSLERACAAGEIEVPSVEVTALLINALLAETALIAVYSNPRVPVAEQEASVRKFLAGLKSG